MTDLQARAEQLAFDCILELAPSGTSRFQVMQMKMKILALCQDALCAVERETWESAAQKAGEMQTVSVATAFESFNTLIQEFRRQAAAGTP